MTHTELAWEFAAIFSELPIESLNELVAKNVPMETLEFFQSYAETFGSTEDVDADTRQRLPNLMLVGYLIRVLEERLLDGDRSGQPPLS